MSPVEAKAKTCLPDFVALDVVQPLTKGGAFSFFLKSHNVSGVFESDFAVDGTFHDGNIELTFQFKRGPELGLPYNIYLVLVATESSVLAWHDFTKGCDDGALVVSVFRGQKFKLPLIKNIAETSLNLRLLIFGR